ncbi:MAG: polyprenyl synthetase family protein [Myxococcota bacterium]
MNNGASDVELGRAAINGALGRFLESERVRESFAPLGAGLLEDFAAFVLGEGKRFRPLLVLASWRGLGPGPVSDPQVPLGVGVALELFHTFLLIHDDIIDDADMRRGAATLRRRLADRHAADANARRLGDHLAIILGDICFTLALEHLNALPMPDPIARTVLTELLRYARLTGVGQVMDVAAAAQPLGGVTGEQILLCYDLKTAQYTIECPLVLGAMLAGATDVEMDALRRYARALGVAYQIRDDLIGVSREVGEKSGTLDFEQGRQTLLLALTLEGAHPQGRRWLEERFGAGALSAPDAERLLELYRTTGAVEVIEGRIARLRQEALEALGALDEGSGAQRLRALVHQLVPV